MFNYCVACIEQDDTDHQVLAAAITFFICGALVAVAAYGLDLLRCPFLLMLLFSASAAAIAATAEYIQSVTGVGPSDIIYPVFPLTIIFGYGLAAASMFACVSSLSALVVGLALWHVWEWVLRPLLGP